MKQVTGMVSDDAKNVLREYQTENGINQQGKAIESLLLEFKEQQTRSDAANESIDPPVKTNRSELLETGAQIMIEALQTDGQVSEDIDKAKAATEAIRDVIGDLDFDVRGV